MTKDQINRIINQAIGEGLLACITSSIEDGSPIIDKVHVFRASIGINESLYRTFPSVHGAMSYIMGIRDSKQLIGSK